MIYLLLVGYAVCFVIAVIQGSIGALLIWSLPLFAAALAFVVVAAIMYYRYRRWLRQNGFR